MLFFCLNMVKGITHDCIVKADLDSLDSLQYTKPASRPPDGITAKRL
jgi:hypothetical protein